MSPRISLVIPTWKRETRLAFALEALAEQTAERTAFEVIVVRAPGAPKPWADPPAGLPVRFLIAGQPGAVPQRNTGWEAAAAPLVAFLDDDCRVAPDWLEEMLRVVEREGEEDTALVIQGRTEPDPDELHLLFGLARSIEITGPSGLYESCNIVYSRAMLEQVGGFDPGFGMPWGEDTDLGLRVEQQGGRLVYASDAVAWHAVHANPLPAALLDAGRRRFYGRLIRRHPRLRRDLLAGAFVNEAHAAVAAAGAALLAAGLSRRRLWALAALAPYFGLAVRNFRREGPTTSRRVARYAVHMPARAAVDVAETAATVYGALQNRTLVV